MADASAELRRLEQKIKELERDHRKRLASLRENYEARERKLRAEYEELLERRGREAEEKVNLALRRSEEELERAQKEYFRQVEEAETKAKKEREKYLARMETLAAENKAEVDRIREEAEKQEKKAHKACQEIRLETEEARRETDELPHEYFFPRQMTLFGEEYARGRSFLGQRLYEAAAAIMSAAGLQMRTLAEKTRKRQQEWEAMYEQYKALVTSMYESLAAFRGASLNTAAGEFTLENDAIRDYWCGGAFTPAAQMAEKEYAVVRAIEENGHTAYLKKREPLSDYQVMKTIREAKKLEKQLQAAMDIIVAERSFSDERYVIGNRLADIYEGQGYDIELCGFRGDNPTDVFEVYAIFRSKGGEAANDIRFTIVPVRENGVTVRNRCFIWMGKMLMGDAALVEALFGTARERFREASGGRIPEETAGEKDLPAAERRLKQEISAGKLAEVYMKTVKLEIK